MCVLGVHTVAHSMWLCAAQLFESLAVKKMLKILENFPCSSHPLFLSPVSEYGD